MIIIIFDEYYDVVDDARGCLHVEYGQVVVGVDVVRVRANGAVEIVLGFDDDIAQLLLMLLMLLFFGPGQQHCAQIVHGAGVVGP